MLKSGAMDGAQLSAEGVKKLADLESREVLLAKAAGVLKAKIGQAAFAFNALPVKAVRTSMLCAKSSRRGGLTRQAMFHAATGCAKLPNNLHSCRPIRKDATHG